MTIAERNGVVLRQAREDDLPRLDELTILCYTPIQASYEAMLGQECYEAVRNDPELSWQERKCAQVRQHFQTYTEGVWALEDAGEVFGFVTFYLVPEKNYGGFSNNGIHPARQGQGWGTFMYRHVPPCVELFPHAGASFRVCGYRTGRRPCPDPPRLRSCGFRPTGSRRRVLAGFIPP